MTGDGRLQDARVVTSGAYVVRGGRFLFAIGPKHGGDTLAVVRIGGHLEPGETAEGCLIREAEEEASIAVRLVDPPATHWVDGDESSSLDDLVAVSGISFDGTTPVIVVSLTDG